MELKLGDVQTTALIPLAVKANETLRKNARIKDPKAVEIIKALKLTRSPMTNSCLTRASLRGRSCWTGS